MSRHLKWLCMTTWLNRHVISQIGNPHYKFDGHTFYESVYVTMKTKIKFCDDLTLPRDKREVWADVGYWTIFCVSVG